MNEVKVEPEDVHVFNVNSLKENKFTLCNSDSLKSTNLNPSIKNKVAPNNELSDCFDKFPKKKTGKYKSFT